MWVFSAHLLRKVFFFFQQTAGQDLLTVQQSVVNSVLLICFLAEVNERGDGGDIIEERMTTCVTFVYCKIKFMLYSEPTLYAKPNRKAAV